MDLTILEIHLDGATFNAPFSSGDGKTGADGDETGTESDATTPGMDLRPLVVLVVLLGLAVLARYLRSGREEADTGDETEATDTR